MFLQKKFRSRHAKNSVRVKRALQLAASRLSPDEEGEGGLSRTPVEWVEALDPQSRTFYYYNTVTGKTQWEKPESLADD